jgi:hypothetical protein
MTFLTGCPTKPPVIGDPTCTGCSIKDQKAKMKAQKKKEKARQKEMRKRN